MADITDAMRDWLSGYRDGSQNGERYAVNSVWTRGKGDSHRGMATCRKRGLITSVPDGSLRSGGWRHDLTETGRAVVDAMQAEREAERQQVFHACVATAGHQPWYGSADHG